MQPNVSLYDHSKTTAALAVALWRYHADQGHDPAEISAELRAQWDRQQAGNARSQAAWEHPKFLLVQGDLFGIQSFIFAEGGQTQKRAAKLLRGRSFYVSLLTELAALKVLDGLSLPSTSQIINAAGKFTLVAPNTPAVIEQLTHLQQEMNNWFLKHTWGQSGIGLAWIEASSADFKQGDDKNSPFKHLMQRLFQQLEISRLQRFELCSANPTAPVFQDFLDQFNNDLGECQMDGLSPATIKHKATGLHLSDLAADQMDIGQWLTQYTCLQISRTRPNAQAIQQSTLRLPLFGYWVSFTHPQKHNGAADSVLRVWDFSLPESENEALWRGYARRSINAHIPYFDNVNTWDNSRYQGLENSEDFSAHEPKTLNHLARDDRKPDPEDATRWISAEALITLKGDVDSLGQIFQQGLQKPTFAKMAALSRQMNAFFTLYLPWLCRQDYPNTYTVFAGGDDFFLIGPWYSTLKLANRLKTEFQRYVANNPDIHFSSGLSMTKPGLPIRQLAKLAEQALQQAKDYNNDKGEPVKNAVTCWNITVSWADFELLMLQEAQNLEHLAEEYGLSTGYLYGLLHLTDLAAQEKTRPQAAIWHAYFAYQTRRWVETYHKSGADAAKTEQRRQDLQKLAQNIAHNGIQTHRAAYKIALFTYLYQHRAA